MHFIRPGKRLLGVPRVKVYSWRDFQSVGVVGAPPTLGGNLVRHWGRFLFVLLAVGLSSGICLAQYSSSVQGVITDSSGAVISNASIELRNLDTGIKLSTTTSGSGNFSFTSLSPGRYVVRAQAKGLQTTEVDVTLGTTETQGIDITLPVASMSQTTVVTEQAAPIDVDESRFQTTLDSDTTRELPELNRDLRDVLSVSPGIVGTGTRGAGASPGGGSDNFGTQPPQISANGRSYAARKKRRAIWHFTSIDLLLALSCGC